MQTSLPQPLKSPPDIYYTTQGDLADACGYFINMVRYNAGDPNRRMSPTFFSLANVDAPIVFGRPYGRHPFDSWRYLLGRDSTLTIHRYEDLIGHWKMYYQGTLADFINMYSVLANGVECSPAIMLGGCCVLLDNISEFAIKNIAAAQVQIEAGLLTTNTIFSLGMSMGEILKTLKDFKNDPHLKGMAESYASDLAALEALGDKIAKISQNMN